MPPDSPTHYANVAPNLNLLFCCIRAHSLEQQRMGPDAAIGLPAPVYWWLWGGVHYKPMKRYRAVTKHLEFSMEGVILQHITF
jgi:hypothetical protein